MESDAWESNNRCHCLLGTLEQIQGGKPVASITGVSAEAFGLAIKIPLGATPENSLWAKAAAKGIEDYLEKKVA